MKSMLYYLAAVCGVLAVALLLLQKKHRLRAVSFLLALAVAAAAFALAQLGLTRGLVYAEPATAPEDTVSAFFSALVRGDAEGAEACLGEGSQLTLDDAPDDPAAAALFAALRESYAWRPLGAAERDALEATQRVAFTTLDIEALTGEIRPLVMARLEELVEERAYDEVYDENGMYRAAVTDEVYREAVLSLLENRERFLREETLTVRLAYDGDRWQIRPDSTLTRVLSGAAA